MGEREALPLLYGDLLADALLRGDRLWCLLPLASLCTPAPTSYGPEACDRPMSDELFMASCCGGDPICTCGFVVADAMWFGRSGE